MRIPKCDKLLWIGAGTVLHDTSVFSAADSIVLVEAREDACSELKETYSQFENLEIKNAVVSPYGGVSTISHFNVEELLAQSDIADVKSIYPGLKLAEKEVVETIGLAQLAEQCGFNSNSTNVLVLDLFESTAELIDALFASQNASLFSLIIVLDSDIQYFKGTSSYTRLTEVCNSRGLIQTERNEFEPGLSFVSLQPNPLLTVVSELEAKLEGQLKRLSDCDNHLAMKTKELEELSKIILANEEEFRSNLNSIANEKEDLNSSLQVAELEISKLGTKLAGQISTIESQQVEITSLQSSVSGYQEKLIVVERSQKTLESELVIKSGKIESLENEVDSLNTSISDYQKDLHIAKVSLKDTEATLAEKSSKIEGLGEEIVLLQTSIRDFQEKISVAERSRETLESELESKLETIESLQSEVGLHKTRIRDYQEELKVAESTNKALESDAASKAELMKRLEDEVASQQSLLNEYQDKLNTAESSLSSLESDVATRAETIESLEDEIISLQSSISTYQEKLNVAETSHTTLESAYEEKSKWLQDHEKWNKSLQSEIEQLKSQLASSQHNIEGFEEENAKLKKHKEELSEQQYRNAKLDIELQKLNAKFELLNSLIVRDNE